MATTKTSRGLLSRIAIRSRSGEDVSIPVLEITEKKSGFFSIKTHQRPRRATPAAMAEFEARRAELERIGSEKLELAKKLQQSLNGMRLAIPLPCDQNETPLGAVTSSIISDGLVNAGFQVDRSCIRMPNGPIRSFGDHAIEIVLHTDLTAEIVADVSPLHINVPQVVADIPYDFSVISDDEMLREAEEALVHMSSRMDEILEYMAGSEERIANNREAVRLALASEYQVGG